MNPARRNSRDDSSSRAQVGGPNAPGDQVWAPIDGAVPRGTGAVVVRVGGTELLASELIDHHGPRLRARVGQGPYRAAITSLEFMSMVMVHPEVPRNSNGAGLGPRR